MERFRTDQPGIVSWHAFSAGPHYDPTRLSFGPVIGCDEHVVEPGAGFDWHAHRGVVIVSIVLDGTLWHRDGDGGERRVGAGGVLVQATGDGIRHAEFNASDTEPLRFVQTTILADAEPGVYEAELPGEIAGVRLTLRVDDGESLVIAHPASVGSLAITFGDPGSVVSENRE